MMSGSNSRRERTLVVKLRRSRDKALHVATSEVVSVLKDLGAQRSSGGPLAEERGTAWVTIFTADIYEVEDRLRQLGYVEEIYLVDETDEYPSQQRKTTKWKGREVGLVQLYAESTQSLQQFAPDRRPFLLVGQDGSIQRVKGYRGGSGPLERRALPVVDARLLVNLVLQPKMEFLLDPFAGTGGIIISANSLGWTTVSMDVDKDLRFGLSELANIHMVGSADALPFRESSFDAIATEPPYHPEFRPVLIKAITEMNRVIRPEGRCSILVSDKQAPVVRSVLDRLLTSLEVDEPIDRKGTPVHCFCWTRTTESQDSQTV